MEKETDTAGAQSVSDTTASGDKTDSVEARLCALRLFKRIFMAEFKRRTLVLSTGKQIKLFGTSVAIGKSLEIGEGYAPNIFSSGNDAVANPHQLTIEELMEIADYSMQLWMELKSNLRKYGTGSAKLFNQDVMK